MVEEGLAVLVPVELGLEKVIVGMDMVKDKALDMALAVAV